MAAPMRSASYSRERLIAICTSMAANGATSTAASTPIQPNLPLRAGLPNR